MQAVYVQQHKEEYIMDKTITQQSNPDNIISTQEPPENPWDLIG